MPAGQLLVLQILAATHPIDCIALLEIATPSAPKAMALTKSIGTRKPPVMIKVTSPLAPCSFKYLRALANAGIVGTLIWSLNISGAAPVPPPRPSRII